MGAEYMGFIILEAFSGMSHLHLHLFYLAASASCYSLPQDPRNFPIDEEAPEYEIVEITPNELEAIVNIHNPAIDHLIYPADFFEVLQDPSSIDYLDASYHEDKDDFPFYGENLNTENLKYLLKEAENPLDGLEKSPPRTSTIRTTVTPTIRKETKMTKERRGMLEVPNFRPDEARDPKFLFRGRKKRSAPVFVKKNNVN